MDLSAIVLFTAWLGLAGVYGWGWLLCFMARRHNQPIGNTCESNAPLYGLIAVAALCNAVLFGIIGFGDMPSGNQARYLNRMLGQLPLVLLFIAVAVARRPWKRGE